MYQLLCFGPQFVDSTHFISRQQHSQVQCSKAGSEPKPGEPKQALSDPEAAKTL